MFKIEKLNKFYNKGKQNELYVTKNISLEFQSTGFVCILGESGCGKTTLINEIGGLDNYNSGEIIVDESTVKGYKQTKMDKIRTQKFGYIFQNYYLLQERTVEYNIELILNMYKLPKHEKEKRINYVLKAVDLENYNKRIVSQLSGGQQQRVAIARALAKSPSIIFADEPTGNLDEINTLKTISILKKISEGCLVIMVTHDEKIADCFADRIIKMSDGQIIADQINKNRNIEYNFIDSSKIYLGGLNNNELSSENIDFNIYDENQKVDKVKLDIVYENDKVYVSSGDNNIVFVSKDSGIKMVNESIPRLTINDLNSIQYSLEKIESKKVPKLHLLDLLKFTLTNFISMGKRRIVLALSFFVISILVSIFIANWMTINSLDYESCVYTDSHIINLNFSMASAIGVTEYNQAQYDIYNEIKGHDKNAEILPCDASEINYIYDGFAQINGKAFPLKKYSTINIDKLDEGQLEYGRMPKNMYEIVVDNWTINNLKDNLVLSCLISNNKNMLGKTIQIEKNEMKYNFTIVGICNTNAPNIYVNKSGLYMLSNSKSFVSALGELNKIANKYSDNYLSDKQAILGESLYMKITADERSEKKYIVHDTMTYSVLNRIQFITEELSKKYNLKIESFYNENSAKYSKTYFIYNENDKKDYEQLNNLIYVSDKYMDKAAIDMAVGTNNGRIYANDTEEMLQYITNTIKPKYKDKVNIIAIYPYKNQTRALEYSRMININSKSIVTFIVFLVAVLISYFTIKANVIKNIKDISVYRLLGITKLNIISSFALEIAIITTYSSVIGCVLMGALINFVSGIESLNINYIYPWYMVAVTILIIYAVNIIISMLPVISILKLPPAQLAAKYDM